jgi:hypothetical protein
MTNLPKPKKRWLSAPTPRGAKQTRLRRSTEHSAGVRASCHPVLPAYRLARWEWWPAFPGVE